MASGNVDVVQVVGSVAAAACERSCSLPRPLPSPRDTSTASSPTRRASPEPPPILLQKLHRPIDHHHKPVTPAPRRRNSSAFHHPDLCPADISPPARSDVHTTPSSRCRTAILLGAKGLVDENRETAKRKWKKGRHKEEHGREGICVIRFFWDEL